MVSGGTRLRVGFAFASLASLAAPEGNAQVGSEARELAESEAAVTPPELIKFVPAMYPQAAAASGLQAEVVLALDIDADGRVTNAEVVAPAGHGFDEAARAAALGFEFTPARRSGRAVRSRILYRYAFELAPAAPAAAPASSSLGGRVLDADTEQPLGDVRVRLERANAPGAEARTRADGRFEFLDLRPGNYAVSLERDGYLPLTLEERIEAEERVEATYRLERPPADTGIQVVVRGTRPRREVTRRPLARRELTRIPGTSGDALRAIQNLPGIARPPSLSGVLAVRGTGSQSTPIFVDGLWMPHVYHFGGLSSVVPSEMLDEIDFYPGNFSVRYGRALGGVVDAHLRETRDDGRYHGLLQLDLIDGRGVLEGPVPGLSGWNFIAGFRRSHVDAWLTPLLEDRETQIQAAPVYYDYQLMFDTRPTPTSYLRLGLLGADDRFRLVSSSSATGGQLETLNASWGLGLIYEASLGEHVSLDLTLTTARLHERFALSTILVDTVAYGSISRGELGFRLWNGATLRAGFDVLFAPYEVQGNLPDDPGPSAPAVGSFVTTPTRRVEKSDLYLQPAVFAELELRPSARFELVSGVRLDYAFDTGRYDVSPRMSARYELVPGFPSTALKAGSGLFHQPPGLGEIVLSEERSLRSMRSFQNSLGVEQELNEQVELSVEGFFNLLDDLVTRGEDESGLFRYDNSGTGLVYGAEVLLRYKADDRFFGWLGYTLSRSERTWIPGEPSRLFYLDQTHILTALASFDLGRGWELGGRFRFVSGNLYTPCQGGIYSSLSTEYLCLDGPLNGERLPPFHQLDLRVDKRWVFSGFTLGAYLDLINAYNRTNPDFISYNYDYTQSRAQTGSLPIIPSLGLRGEF